MIVIQKMIINEFLYPLNEKYDLLNELNAIEFNKVVMFKLSDRMLVCCST